jgi:UDP-2,3-diacylglucosamine pyrophosphatase LpxH
MEFSNGDRPKLAPRLLNRFEQYNMAMGPTLYITGNHDNWTLGYFDDIGFEVESEYRILEIDDRELFLHHGDGFSDSTYRYPRKLMHRLLRNPLFLKVYRGILPNKLALKLMKGFSEQSRDDEHYNSEEIEKHNQWARWLLNEFKFDAMIFGHDHLPRQHTVNQKSFVNCGAFFEHHTLASYTNQQLQLVRWDEQTKSLEPVTDSLTSN